MKSNLYRLLLLVLSLLPGILRAQSTGTVIGIVIDASTKEPIPGATVYIDVNTGTITNGVGKYSIDLLPGEHEISYHYMGFESDFKKIISIRCFRSDGFF